MMSKGKSKTNVPALSEAAQAVFDPAINEYKKQQGGIFSGRKAFGIGGAGPGSKFAQNKFNTANTTQTKPTMAEILKNSQQDYQDAVTKAATTQGFDPSAPTPTTGLSALINFLQSAGPGVNQGAPSLGPMGSMGSAVSQNTATLPWQPWMKDVFPPPETGGTKFTFDPTKDYNLYNELGAVVGQM